MPKSRIRSEFLFTENHHLNDEGIAAFVDALRSNKVDNLPDDMRDHVDECLSCKLEISRLDDVMEELDKAGIKEFAFDELFWNICLN